MSLGGAVTREDSGKPIRLLKSVSKESQGWPFLHLLGPMKTLVLSPTSPMNFVSGMANNSLLYTMLPFSTYQSIIGIRKSLQALALKSIMIKKINLTRLSSHLKLEIGLTYMIFRTIFSKILNHLRCTFNSKFKALLLIVMTTSTVT